jgi:hypothetical protein
MCIQSISGFMSWIVMCETNSKNVPDLNKDYIPLLSKIIEVMLRLLSNKVFQVSPAVVTFKRHLT